VSAPDYSDTSINTLPNSQSDLLASLYDRKPYITSTTEFVKETNTKRAIVYWLTNFENLARVNEPSDILFSLSRAISHIDNLINNLLNEIIHQDAFQRLEASWRGLWHLVAQADGIRNIKIRYLDISWAEISKDIERALDFDQSQLFHKIYSEEFGTPGGEPFGVILGDYQVSHKRSERHNFDDIATLHAIGQISAAAFAPFITSVSSEFFGLDTFAALGQPINFQSIFAQAEYNQWRALREKQDSRFIGLTLPRILMRGPYRTKPGSYKGIYFYEKPNEGAKRTSQLWGNACYAFGGVLIREFANIGWFGHIRGVARDQIGGGLVTNLTTIPFETDSTNIATKPSVDVIITDSVERELVELGLIPLCQCYDTPFTAFYSNSSIQQSMRRSTRSDDINSKLSAMLQHVLCASRIAHYIKVMIRDKIGSFITAEECERFLLEWLYKYTTGRDDLEWEEQARYPLRQASVTVKDHPNKTGQYLCVIHLVPHYQLDQMVSELELVTELTQSS
jgi:type VI secretion system protein ImpD